jgi:DNA-nicking Smr family endonuclease
VRRQRDKGDRRIAGSAKRRATVSTRLADLLKRRSDPATPSSTATPAPPPEDPVSALLDTVTPLAGAPRVPRSDRGQARHEQARPQAAVSFVVEHDGTRVEGYRADVGEIALLPLRRSTWSPQERIDLHGRRAEGLMEELGRIVRDRARRGIRRLLVIHGRGLHSRGGAGVLREVVLEALTEGPARHRARAFRTAPPALGGAGALCIELGE